MRSELHFTGETNHRWKYTSEFSGTEDDEAYEGETAERAGRTVLPAERTEGEAMHKETGKDGLPPCNDENSQGKSYGCLFCMTGKEKKRCRSDSDKLPQCTRYDHAADEV